MAESNGLLPGFPAVCGKPVHVAFDGGRLTSDGGVLLLAQIERQLGLADRLAKCIEDPRDPVLVDHTIAEMIRFRALQSEIAAHDIERRSLNEQIEKLRTSLKGLSPQDQAIIARQGVYEAEQRIIQSLERDATAAKQALKIGRAHV